MLNYQKTHRERYASLATGHDDAPLDECPILSHSRFASAVEGNFPVLSAIRPSAGVLASFV